MFAKGDMLMLAVFRQRDFSLLWIGNFISMMGDWMLLVALPFYVFQRTGSALAMGAIFIVEVIPTLLLGSVAGVFVDRWSRRLTLVVTNVLSALVLLLLLLVQTRSGLWLVYVVAFAESLIDCFASPAYSALVPLIVKEDRLSTANSANKLGVELTRLLGPALGGVILGLFGLTSIILVDSISFLFCALAAFFIFLPEHIEDRQKAAGTTINVDTNIWREWIEGLRLVRGTRIVAAVFIVTGISMIGEGFGRVVFVPFVSVVLHQGAIALGWVLTVQGIGGVLGSLVNERLSKWLSPHILIGWSGIFSGLVVLVPVLFPTLSVLLITFLLVGGPVMFFFIGLYTLLQQHTRDVYRGRIFGTYNTMNTLLLIAGMVLSSTFTNVLGPLVMFGLMGAFYFLAGVVALPLLRNPGIQVKQTEDSVEIHSKNA